MTNVTEQDKKTGKTGGTLSVGGGTLSVGGGSGSASRSSGVAVEVRKKRTFTPGGTSGQAPAKTSKINSSAVSDEERRRLAALEKAQQNAADEAKRREEERKRAEDISRLRQAEAEERKAREEQARLQAELDAERARQQKMEEEALARRTSASSAVQQQTAESEKQRSTLTVERDKKKGSGGKQTIKERKGGGRNAYLEGLENRYRSMGGGSRKRKDRGGYSQQPQEKVVREVTIPEFITVQELASRMSEKAGDVVKKLMLMGQMVTLTQTIDQETAALIVEELGHTYKLTSDAEVEENLMAADDDVADLLERAPIVTVMGHVDHGKTSLLDALRSSNVVSGEAGGITQHIGAYQVTTKNSKKQITFLDTPGHAAFTAMRARGASVTDVVILVVAADDGIMPQTIEAINHAKSAGVPIVVAINKIDKPDANVDKVKQELLSHDLVAEDYGGDTVCVPISALKKTGLDALEEMVILQSDMLDLKANPNRRADGVVVESRLDKGRGSVATVIVTRGTLRVGDILVAGHQWGRVRALINDRGEHVKEAGPAMPVEILGLQGVPEAGDDFAVVEDDKRAREVADYRAQKRREREQAAASKGSALDNLMSRIQEGTVQNLNVIVKGDVQGSVEAIADGLNKLATDEVKVRTVHAAVGVVTESDIMLAQTSEALIVGFNVRANPQARALAEQNGVEIRYYNVIYDLMDDIKAAMSGLLEADLRENVLGTVEVRQVFRFDKRKVLGCFVTSGTVKRGSKTRVLRDGVVVHDGHIDTLKRFKDDVREVQENYECGITLEKFDDVQEGDVLECYEIEEVARTIDDLKSAAEKRAKEQGSGDKAASGQTNE